MSADEYRQLLVALAPAAAVGVFMIQPVMRFTRPLGLFVAGEMIVLALVVGALFATLSKRRGLVGFQILLMFFAAAFIFIGAMLASGQDAWNQRRCIRIQAEMLAPTSRSRSDLPAIFQALGCQPSGAEPRDPDFRHGRYDPPSIEELTAHDRFLENALATELPLTGASTAEAKAAETRCLAIQRDMLSANPRRHDGPDLFQALGCRPQGEGSVYAPRYAR